MQVVNIRIVQVITVLLIISLFSVAVTLLFDVELADKFIAIIVALAALLFGYSNFATAHAALQINYKKQHADNLKELHSHVKRLDADAQKIESILVSSNKKEELTLADATTVKQLLRESFMELSAGKPYFSKEIEVKVKELRQIANDYYRTINLHQQSPDTAASGELHLGAKAVSNAFKELASAIADLHGRIGKA